MVSCRRGDTHAPPYGVHHLTKVKVLTLRWSDKAGGLDDRELEAFMERHAVLEVAEHFFTLVRTQAPGVGETLHGEGAGIVLGAVAHQGAVYHLEMAAVG